MGYACPGKVKGNFFLKTNQDSPFAKKQEVNDKKDDEMENKKDEKKDESKDGDKKPVEETTDPKIDVRSGDLEKAAQQVSSTEKPAASSGSDNKPFRPITDFAKTFSAKIF